LASWIIVAQAVTNQPPDLEHFVPVLERVQQNTGCDPERVSADSGYFTLRQAQGNRFMIETRAP